MSNQPNKEQPTFCGIPIVVNGQVPDGTIYLSRRLPVEPGVYIEARGDKLVRVMEGCKITPVERDDDGH